MTSSGWSEIWRSRTLTLSLSMLLLTASMLFAADFLDLRGDENRGWREARKVVAEALAVQLSIQASVNDFDGIRQSLSSFVKRNDDVTAAALVDTQGMEVAAFGSMAAFDDRSDKSTLSNVTVPILDGETSWGAVRVVFEPHRSRDILYFTFVLTGCLLAYLLFLRKALAQLNPAQVVPGRVNSAFDMLSEGVVILDEQSRILLVNKSVSESIGQPAANLMGQKLDDWAWEQSGEWQAPWTTALHSGLNVANQPLRLRMKSETRTYMVSCAAVGNEDEGMRGVLVTLNDMTVIEQKNSELAMTLRQLRRSQESISRKNKELEELATQDPLTGLFNRRALITNFDREFTKPSGEQKKLGCIMVDIDHFKRINDSLGHAVGDEIICAVARTLVLNSREYDIVGRYGGEEFVVVLPDAGITEAMEIAEQLRIAVTALADDVLIPVNQLSASFGVSAYDNSVESPLELLEHADQALYAAKQGGRNRVLRYDPKVAKLELAEDVTDNTTGESVHPETMSRLIELEAIVDERTKDLELLRGFDSLTGIPKRTLFLQRIDTEMKRAQRMQTNIGVLSVELNDLTRIVSSLGHDIGEKLVVEVVARLEDGLRDADAVLEITQEHNLARITSNEYGVLLADLQQESHVLPVVSRLRHLFTKSFVIGGEKVHIGANIGIALFPKGGQSPTELLENASRARTKAALTAEKVSHCFSSEQLDEESRDYVRLESALYDAMDRGEFEVHFQPKYDLKQRTVSSMEALMRWRHPERGFVSPEVFIRLAEANGLIHSISEFVLTQSVTQLVRWREIGMNNLKISVNISPMQLREHSLVSNLLVAISNADLSPTCLEVELTESSVIDSPQRARVVLQQLRDAGVSVSMDDFGTGYSSLALLADLPLDSVKIDRSFVSAMADSQRSRSIVESIINMARSLNLKVVGEGVETNEQLTILTKLGCHEVQGFLISKPLPATDALEFLRQQSSGRAGAQQV